MQNGLIKVSTIERALSRRSQCEDALASLTPVQGRGEGMVVVIPSSDISVLLVQGGFCFGAFQNDPMPMPLGSQETVMASCELLGYGSLEKQVELGQPGCSVSAVAKTDNGEAIPLRYYDRILREGFAVPSRTR